MKPSAEEICQAAPDLDPEAVRAAVASLPAEYFSLFERPAQIGHLRAAARLSAAEPARVLGERRPDGTARVTVIAYDQPGEFSWVTGLMSSLGADIRTGDVFTFRAVGASPKVQPARRRLARERPSPRPTVVADSKILDVFETAPLPDPPELWAQQLEGELRDLFALYAQTGDLSAVRERVNNRVAERLTGGRGSDAEVLLPLELELMPAEDDRGTTVVVHGQDTPAFLYCLSNAFAASGVYIDSVRIRTIGSRVVDTFRIMDGGGRPLASEEAQARLRLTVLITKQFSHFLGSAADPYKALVHFHALLERLQSSSVAGAAASALNSPQVLRDLARVLGASDFLWEDFVRLQYENLLPLLAHHQPSLAHRSRAHYEEQIRHLLAGIGTGEERCDRLNEFKDQEVFHIDLEHILDPQHSLSRLATDLSALAEAVIAAAVRFSLLELCERFGMPLNVAGEECGFCVLALGKLGGCELGYASDLELLFVYSDTGRTNGPEPVTAADFFSRLAEKVRHAVRAKRQGIFEIDLRLRPFGKHGPLACSLETFCRYYADGGGAMDYERQALIKMRAIAGAEELGQRLAAFRDEILYHARQVRYEAIDDLRRKQHHELAGGSRTNAKFGAGGLVDVEYAVQYLQILYGYHHADLRTPNTEAALQALGRHGFLAPAECEALLAAHTFLCRVVNGLRMLRGNARDLELPPAESLEFGHLARRMGYDPSPVFGAAQQLAGDLGRHMASVRDFCHRRFGRELLVTRESGNLADVALTADMDPEMVRAILGRTGFRNPDRAAFNLRQLLGEGGERDAVCQVIVLAEPLLRNCADSDMALNNWERFARVVISPLAFAESLLREPRALDIFIGIMAASQFLADVLTRNPEYLAWVLQPDQLLRPKTLEQFDREIEEDGAGLRQHEHVLNAFRRCRRRQLLRIGTRDLCLGAPFAATVQELSWLAESIIRAVVRRECRQEELGDCLLAEGGLHLLALGKLGGGELNYSSDVDLLAYLDGGAASRPGVPEAATRVLQRAIRALSSSSASEAGHMYRVDMRLRPFGSQGQLVGRREGLERYYHTQARPWEVQALLKARPVLGDGPAASALVRQLLLQGVQRWADHDFVAEVARARHVAQGRRGLLEAKALNVKTGAGGIRDIEFSVQLLQLRHCRLNPDVLMPDTLGGLRRLVARGALPAPAAEAAADRYRLLRRLEHLLQIMHDRQIHNMPTDTDSLRALARRLLGAAADPQRLRTVVEAAMAANRDLFRATAGTG